MKAYLLELTPYNPATSGTVQVNFSNGLLNEGDLPGVSVAYPVRLKNTFTIDQSVFSSNIPDSPSTSYGTITVSNVDGRFDYLLNYTWGTAPAVLKVGEQGANYSSYTTLFVGSVMEISSDDNELVFTLRDASWKLMKPLQPVKFTGNGDLEGTKELSGNEKPLAFGLCKNVPPIQVDAAYLSYLVSSNALVSIDAVFDDAVPLTFASDYATYSLLKAAQIAPGYYATCLAQNALRLGARPAGNITADIKGQYYSLVNLAATTRAVLMSQGGLTTSDLNETSFTALASDLPYRISGMYYSQPDIQLDSFLDNAMSSGDSFYVNDPDGKLSVKRFKFNTPVASVRQEDVKGLARVVGSKPVYRVYVNYNRNLSVQSVDQFTIPTENMTGYLTAERQYTASPWVKSGEFAVFLDGQKANALGIVEFRKLTTASWFTINSDGTFVTSDPGSASAFVTIRASIGAQFVDETYSLVKDTSDKVVLTVSDRFFRFDENGTPVNSSQTITVAETSGLTGTISWSAFDNLGNSLTLTGTGSSRTIAISTIANSPLTTFIRVNYACDSYFGSVKILVQRGSAGILAATSAARAAIDNIGADSKLTPVEKQEVIKQSLSNAATNSDIQAKATALSITTELTTYTTALTALNTYLGTLSPAWTDTTTTTDITRSTWNSKWGDFYTARQLLLNKIDLEASKVAIWNNISGSGKPQDNATVGANASNLSITMGGGNLLRNSSFEGGTYSASPTLVAAGFALYSNSETINSAIVAGRTVGNGLQVSWTSNTSTKGIFFDAKGGVDNRNLWQPNTTMMLSFYAKASGAAVGTTMMTAWNFGPSSVVAVNNSALTTGWQRYVFRLVWGSSVDTQGFISIASGTANGTASVTFDDIQVEVGDFASAYNANPADFEASNVTMYDPIAAGYTIQGSKVIRNSSVGNSWIHNAYSREKMVGTAIISGVLSTVDTFIGLGPLDLSSSGAYGIIPYSIHRSSNTHWYIYESSSATDLGTGFNADDVWTITYDGAFVRYYCSSTGTTVHKKTAASPNQVLQAVVSIFSAGAYVSGIKLGSYTDNLWNSVVGSGKPSDNAGTSLTLTPLQNNSSPYPTVVGNSVSWVGGGSTWEEGAVASNSLGDTVFASGRVSNLGASMIGLTGLTTTLSGASFSQIRHAVYQSGGNYQIYEDGSYFGTTAVPCALGDLIAVISDGVTVRSYVNGTLVFTSDKSPTGLNLRAMVSLAGGSYTDLQYGPVSSNQWSAVGGAGRPEDYSTRGQNLVWNGDASQGKSGWKIDEIYAGGVFQLSATSEAIGGDYSFKLVKTAIATQGFNVIGRKIAVIPGKYYVYRVRAYGSTATASGMYLRLNYQGSAYTQESVTGSDRTGIFELGQDVGVNLAATTYEKTWKCPPGVFFVSPAIYNWTNGPQLIIFDDVSLTEQVNFSTGVGGDGRPEDYSTSADNMIMNGSLRSGPDPWLPSAGPSWLGNGVAGDPSIGRFYFPANTANNFVIANNNVKIPLNGATTLFASGFAFIDNLPSTFSGVFRVRFDWYSAADGYLTSGYVDMNSSTVSSWVPFFGQVTPHADASQVIILLERSANNGNAYATCIRIAKTEPNADVTMLVTGSAPAVTLNYDYTGVIKADQDKTVNFKMSRGGGTDVTSLATWTAVTKSGTASYSIASTTGVLTITAVSADASIEVTGSYLGAFRKALVSVIRSVDAPPPPSGGTGVGTSDSTSAITGTSSTSYGSANTRVLSCKAGSSGAVSCSFPSNFYKNLGTGGAGCAGKWQWRVVSGTFADITTEIASSFNAFRDASDGTNDPGYIEVTMSKTGLTAGTTYEFQLLLRKTTGGNASFDGTAVVTGV